MHFSGAACAGATGAPAAAQSACAEAFLTPAGVADAEPGSGTGRAEDCPASVSVDGESERMVSDSPGGDETVAAWVEGNVENRMVMRRNCVYFIESVGGGA